MKFYWAIIMAVLTTNCGKSFKNSHNARLDESTPELEFSSSNEEIAMAFDWAKNKALSYAHDGSDPVGQWYEAALPNREAFCMRDVSHQAIGAEILGLGKHNYNMFLKFAQNISEEKNYCSYWEINRHNKPAPIDYQNDSDFWYNLPANFDIISSAFRIYNWTGNSDYLSNPDLINFYELSLNEYIDQWDLGCDEVLNRNRNLHAIDSSRFGTNRGIPTYNEGGRGETKLGIDMTASIIAAYKAYSAMLKLTGDINKAEVYAAKTKEEQKFLNDFWWDEERQAYRSIQYADHTFDYFMVGDNQAFLHYLLYFDVISEKEKVKALVEEYELNYERLIVELKSYLPIIFYENGKADIATKMIIDLCSPKNKRRDYPENSFTIIEHIIRGWMGINVDATSNTLSTISRISDYNGWAEIKNLPLLSNNISVKHFGKTKTEVKHILGPEIKWSAQFPGAHEYLFINGRKEKCFQSENNGEIYSYFIVELKKGEKISISAKSN